MFILVWIVAAALLLGAPAHVRFRRDANGKVDGFDYSNPLLRSIRFTRLRESGGGR